MSPSDYQLTMFGNADIELIEQEIQADVPVAPKKTIVERQRLVLTKGLPEERIEVDLPESEKLAADGTPLKRIGEEVTVKLCFKPAVFFKKLIVRGKYADPRQPEVGVRCAKLPAQLIDGSYLDASLPSSAPATSLRRPFRPAALGRSIACLVWILDFAKHL